MLRAIPDTRRKHRTISRPTPPDKGTNNGGADITIAADQSTSTSFFNVGTFTVNAGVTLTIIATDVWQIKANTINILGNISANSNFNSGTISGGVGEGGSGTGCTPAHNCGGGGGAGYGGSGANGTAEGTGTAGVGGIAYGSATDLNSIETGSQGGSGGCDGVNQDFGGGAIYLYASGNITVSGNITARGNQFGTSTNCTGDGGGSGGGIFLNGSNVTTNIGSTIDVTGGPGGSGLPSHPGGNGAGGRIKIAFVHLTNNGTVSGTGGASPPTNGTFYSQGFYS